MNGDALKTVQWIHTTSGPCTPYEFLLHCHETDYRLDLNRPGYVVGAQFRFLLSLVALAVREEIPESERPSGKISRKQANILVAKGFKEESVAAAYEKVAPCVNLRDPKYPFMQRPPEKDANPKSRKTELGPGIDQVYVLSPTNGAERPATFWNMFANNHPSQVPGDYPTLSEAEATLAFTCFHYYSLTNNGGYMFERGVRPSIKPQNGTPAMHRPGPGVTVTEIAWMFHSSGPLKDLLAMLPQEWISGTGLPARADRTGSQSRTREGHHPLWKATWSSNTSVGYWENNRLTGARTAGVPAAWMPLSESVLAEGNDELAKWWTRRNLDDPFALYRQSSTDIPRPERVDLGTDATELAVEWVAEKKISDLAERSGNRVLPFSSEDSEARIVFLRHLVGGNSGSFFITNSEVFVPDRTLWGIGLAEDTLDEVSEAADLVLEIRNRFVSIFSDSQSRGKTSGKKSEKSPGFKKPIMFRQLRRYASTSYWRAITRPYEQFLQDMAGGTADSEKLGEEILRVTCAAYDEVTEPYLEQNPAQVYSTRAYLYRIVSAVLRAYY